MSTRNDLKPFPDFASDAAAEEFVSHAELSDYDLSEFKPMHFSFGNKTTQINMRVPTLLLEAVKKRAQTRGISVTQYICGLLERDIA